MNTTVNVIITVSNNCMKCPYCVPIRKPGDIYDYKCSHKNNRYIMTNVEYDRDIKPIPNWCPFMEIEHD